LHPGTYAKHQRTRGPVEILWKARLIILGVSQPGRAGTTCSRNYGHEAA